MGGFNVAPAEVERSLAGLDGISEAAVIGVPDEHFGEVGVAFVIPKPGVTLSPEYVIAFAREHLANYKVPRRIKSSSSTSPPPATSGASSGASATTGSTGGSSGSAAPSGAPIVVGNVSNLTNVQAGIQPDDSATPNAWVKWTNAHGGINGHPVKLVQLDDGADPGKALADVQQLVQQDHVVALVR